MGKIKLDGKEYESVFRGDYDLDTEAGRGQYRLVVERRLIVEARHIRSREKIHP
jgi:hypothetical protein